MDIENLSRALRLARFLRDRQKRIKTLEAGPEQYEALICVDDSEPTGLTVTRAALIDKAVTARTEAAEALRAIGVTVSPEAEKELSANISFMFGSYPPRGAG